MKKLSAIIIAMALVLGLGQCKKQETTTTIDLEEGMVYITVNVGDEGSRHEVYPNTGAYVFTNGDLLYVGNNGHFIGTLEYQDGAFSGGIYQPSTSDYLHFYFLGGKGPQAPETGTESFTLNIADQRDNLPVLSYAPSTQKYTDANATYSTILRNKCALVEFTTNQIATAVSISGMKTEATINFNDNTIAPTNTTGDLTLHAESATSRWAILLPGEEVTTTATAAGYEDSESFTVPAVAINNYLTDESAVSFEMTALCPTGAINALFSVSATQQIYFSQGNLQYIGSATPAYWKFADNQWDYLGTTSGQNSSSQTVDRDLFAWATSGYNHGASSYQPWATGTSNSLYYAYGNSSYNLYDQTGKAEWGYNAIANGGNQENIGWRTLTNSEYDYLFFTRTDAASKYGHGKVNGVNGMILLPDAWTLPDGLTFTSGNSSYANVYNSEQWSQMEANGAVFLPAAGHRRGTTLYNVGNNGYYWGSARRDTAYSYSIDYYSGSIYPQGLGYYPRGYCLSVRLVRNL